MPGLLIAFEGLDQSGKQTQAERLRDHLVEGGALVRLLSFPAYETHIGAEIERALRGTREFGPEVMQLLYITNRYEYRARIAAWLAEGVILLCDRYMASSVAYGAPVSGTGFMGRSLSAETGGTVRTVALQPGELSTPRAAWRASSAVAPWRE